MESDPRWESLSPSHRWLASHGPLAPSLYATYHLKSFGEGNLRLLRTSGPRGTYNGSLPPISRSSSADGRIGGARKFISPRVRKRGDRGEKPRSAFRLYATRRLGQFCQLFPGSVAPQILLAARRNVNPIHFPYVPFAYLYFPIAKSIPRTKLRKGGNTNEPLTSTCAAGEQ